MKHSGIVVSFIILSFHAVAWAQSAAAQSKAPLVKPGSLAAKVQPQASPAKPGVAPVLLPENPGVKTWVVNGKRITCSETDDVTVEVLANGNVRLIAPEQKQTVNNTGLGKRYTWLGIRPTTVDEEKALYSPAGMALPPGQYTFRVDWYLPQHVTTQEAIPISDIDSKEKHSRFHFVDISVVEKTGTMPPELVNVSAVPVAYLANYKVDLGGKIFAPTEYMMEASYEQVFSKISHLQASGHVAYPKMTNDQKWILVRNYPAHWGGHLDVELAAGESKSFPFENVKELDDTRTIGANGAGYDGSRDVVEINATTSGTGKITLHVKNKTSAPLKRKVNYFVTIVTKPSVLVTQYTPNKNTVFFAQLEEDGLRPEQAQEFFKLFYERSKKELGIKSPAELNLFSDYFDHLSGVDNHASFPNSIKAEHREKIFAGMREGFASEAAARKCWNNQWSDKPHTWGRECHYTAQKQTEYRNWYAHGYMDHPDTVSNGNRHLSLIADLERKYIAVPDRKTPVFSWTDYTQTSQTSTFLMGEKIRVPFAEPAGEMIVETQTFVHAYEVMLRESYYSLLVGDGIIFWDVFSELTKNQDRFMAWFGRTWIPKGGKPQGYDEKNVQPGQPKQKEGKGSFDFRATSLTGAMAGAWQYSQIRNRSAQLEYAEFNYTVNGKKHHGYDGTDKPVSGKNGTPSASRRNAPNPGQHNIVTACEHQKPLCFWMKGPEGEAVSFDIVHLGVNETATVAVTKNLKTHTFTVKGPGLHVRKL